MQKATQDVLRMGQLNFTGNIIPHAWYQYLTKTVRRKNTKETTAEIKTPYLEAIIILSDICYWYRPRIVRDEMTNQVIRYERRFSGEKLQRSYQQLANMFGIGKDQARAAVQWLSKNGYIITEQKTIITKDGRKLPNVMFISPVIEKIAAISNPPVVSDVHSIPDIHSTCSPIDIDDDVPCTPDTNTEIMPEITTQTSGNFSELTGLPPTDNPLSISNDQEQERLSGSNSSSRDYLGDVFEYANSQQAQRPEGWQSTKQPVFEICVLVAELWFGGRMPKPEQGDDRRIRDWQRGAKTLLGYHDGDALATRMTLDRYHAHYVERELTIALAGPHSLVNVVSQFMAANDGNGNGRQNVIRIGR